jgi:hypothetical protein
MEMTKDFLIENGYWIYVRTSVVQSVLQKKKNETTSLPMAALTV